MKNFRSFSLSLFFALILFSTNFSSLRSAEKQLVVHTYESFVSKWGPGPKLKDAFEKQCNCELLFRGFADGVVLLTNLKLHGDNTKADIILGLDNNLMSEAESLGYFAKHGIDTSSVIIPFDHSWDIFLPYDYGYFSFIYNTEKLSTPPNSLFELLSLPDISFIMQDPRSSTPGLGFVAMIEKLYEGDSVELWRKIASKIRTVTPGWSEAYSLFLNGEADMVVSYITSQAYHEANDEIDKYRAIAFDEGNYIQVEFAAMTKRGKNENLSLSQEFFRFLLKDEAQDIIANNNWMYPVTDYINKLPNYFTNLPKVKKTLYWSPEEVKTKRKDWISRWQEGLN